MTIKASIVADSINPVGNRLTTWLLYYPRSIHSELMTHRAFSRNSASSRAIPIEKMIQRVLDDPFIPKWSEARPGMTVVNEYEDSDGYLGSVWLYQRDSAVLAARELAHKGIAKSVVNRLLEPWMHIEVVLSATEWNNWFLLRDDPAAEPHIRELAHMMKELYAASDPVYRKPHFLNAWRPSPCRFMFIPVGLTTEDEWHLPFIGEGAYTALASGDTDMISLIKESIAHAAWVSYGNAAGKKGFTSEDVDRVYDKLVGSQPIHASPTEHVAVACPESHRHANFVGWCSYRNFLPGQSGGDYVLQSAKEY